MPPARSSEAVAPIARSLSLDISIFGFDLLLARLLNFRLNFWLIKIF